MKLICFIWLLLMASIVKPSPVYNGSTPAALLVRDFLGIPITDSVYFIRWRIRLQNDKYELSCNYGIGEANTNGFVGKGKQLAVHGTLITQTNFHTLQYGNKILRLLILNSDLLQLASSNGTPLQGNEGWNYTLSNESPGYTRLITSPIAALEIKDSVVFVGRTPCFTSPHKTQTTNCYKLKWKLTLYADQNTHQPKSYEMKGSFSNHQIQKGNCSVVKNKIGNLIYCLQNNGGNLYLQAISPDVIVFTDKDGKPLIGNEDFSFTLNRK